MSSASPRITVVTAARQALAGLRATWSALAAQEEPGFEWIVLDAASDDGTADWLENLGDARVRWVSEPDGGIADALNKGIAMARGDWILVLGAGDVPVGPAAFGKALRRLAEAEAAGAEIVSFDVLFVAGGVERLYRTRGFSRKLAFKTTIPHQGAFVARTLHDRVGGYDPAFRVAMDYEFWVRARRGGARVLRVPEALARMPDDGVSSRRDWPSLRARFAEERRVHEKHARGPMRAVYALYWPAYLAYRRMRAAAGGG